MREGTGEVKEDIFEVVLEGSLNKKIMVGATNAVTVEIINFSRFIEIDSDPTDGSKIVSVGSSLCQPVIVIWKQGNDGIFRWETDINVTEKSVSIERKMPNGESRRTDVSIVF